MRIAISGASGFVGSKLVERLNGEGHSLHLFSRGSLTTPPPKTQVFKWNPSAEEPAPDSLQGVDAVVHLAGEGIAERRWSDAQKKRIFDSRVVGTRNLVNVLNRQSKRPSVLVCASAIGFYGDRGAEEMTESASPGTGFLSEVCQAWEAETKKLSTDVRCVNVRIGVVLGNGGMLKKLLPLFKLGLGGPVGSGQQWMSWVHVEDLVDLIRFSLTNQTLNGPVNATAPKPVTNAEFSKALGKALHRPAVMPAPAFAIKLAMGEMSEIVLGSTKVRPKKATDSGFRFLYPEIDVALTDIIQKKSNAVRNSLVSA